MPLSSVLRARTPRYSLGGCGGSLNPAKPCQGDPAVVQVHRVKVKTGHPGAPSTIDVDLLLCASHAKRLKVGSTVRGVTIVSQRAL